MSNTQPVRPDEVAKYGEHELNLIADANAKLIARAPRVEEVARKLLALELGGAYGLWGELRTALGVEETRSCHDCGRIEQGPKRDRCRYCGSLEVYPTDDDE